MTGRKWIFRGVAYTRRILGLWCGRYLHRSAWIWLLLRLWHGLLRDGPAGADAVHLYKGDLVSEKDEPEDGVYIDHGSEVALLYATKRSAESCLHAYF